MIIMTVLPQFASAVEAYVQTFFNEQLCGPLNMIETWMVNGTDHWFLKPSVWECIPVARRETIASDIRDFRFNIGAPYPRSIFDQIRESELATEEANAAPKEQFDREKTKLADRGY